MELATVMPSARMTSNGSMDRQTLRIGRPQRQMRMLALGSMALAVARWTSGRPTLSPRPTQPILALLKVNTGVRALSVVTMPAMRGTMESVTKMDVTLPHTGLETRPFGALAQGSL